MSGSGTSFRSISDLMDNFEKTIEKDTTQEKLFALFKGYHPSAGGKNVDKLVKAASFVKIPEYVEATRILGSEFTNWDELHNLVKKLVKGNSPADYGNFLKAEIGRAHV